MKDTLLGYSHTTRIMRNAILDMKEVISSTPLDITKDYLKTYNAPLRELRQQISKLQQVLHDMEQMSEIIDFKLEALNQRCRELIVSASLLVCDAIQHVQTEEEVDEDALSSQIMKEKQIQQAIE